MGDLGSVYEMITDAMVRAGADAVASYDPRFEGCEDAAIEVFVSMVVAGGPDTLERLAKAIDHCRRALPSSDAR